MTGIFRSCVVALIIGVSVGQAAAQSLSVWAASSLKTLLEEVKDDWPDDLTLVFAGTPKLARQIAAGAPADVFIAAHPQWTQYLVQRDRITQDAVNPVFGNTLVLISHTPRSLSLTSDRLVDALAGDRLALPITRSVPAGVYSKQALQNLGQWSDVKSQLVETQNVRQALALVARGEVPLGLVYASDAQAEDRVHIAATIPEQRHDTITYTAAQLTQSGAKFIDWMQSTTFQSLLEKHGFKVLK